MEFICYLFFLASWQLSDVLFVSFVSVVTFCILKTPAALTAVFLRRCSAAAETLW